MLLEDSPNFQSKSQKMLEWNQAISKIYMECKGTQPVKTLLRSKKVRELALNIIVIVSKIAWYCFKERQIEQCNRIQSSETDVDK